MSAARIDPEAAAAGRTASTGTPLEPDAAFAVYRLGRTAFHAAVVRRVGDGHVVVAERHAAIGGAEFDGLLVAYLSGRHPDAGVRLWSRIEDPAGPADQKLRSTLLDKITRARGQLSEQDFTVITLPAADVKLPLTRDELESRIEELVEATVDLLEDALAEAGVAPEALADVLMAGGAARTPLAAAALHRRFGIAPVLAVPPGKVLEDEAPPAETRELPLVDEEPVRTRGRARAVAVVAVLTAVVAAGAAFGSQLGDGDAPEGGTGAPESAPAASVDPEPTSAATSPQGDDTASGEDGETSEPPDPDSAGEEPANPTRDETDSEDERPTTESAPTGTVPELVGLSTAEAREAVDRAGFADVEQTGEERGLFDFGYDDCEVIEQAPDPGTTRPLSETVAVTFSYSGDASECES